MHTTQKLLGSLLLSLTLAACTTPAHKDTPETVGGIRHQSTVDHRANNTSPHDPLLDAPHRTLITCISEQPVTVLKRFKEVRFACKSLGVSATIDEMRDAGWRLLNLDIGEETESNNHVGFPVTVTLRKLF